MARLRTSFSRTRESAVEKELAKEMKRKRMVKIRDEREWRRDHSVLYRVLRYIGCTCVTGENRAYERHETVTMRTPSRSEMILQATLAISLENYTCFIGFTFCVTSLNFILCYALYYLCPCLTWTCRHMQAENPRVKRRRGGGGQKMKCASAVTPVYAEIHANPLNIPNHSSHLQADRNTTIDPTTTRKGRYYKTITEIKVENNQPRKLFQQIIQMTARDTGDGERWMRTGGAALVFYEGEEFSNRDRTPQPNPIPAGAEGGNPFARNLRIDPSPSVGSSIRRAAERVTQRSRREEENAAEKPYDDVPATEIATAMEIRPSSPTGIRSAQGDTTPSAAAAAPSTSSAAAAAPSTPPLAEEEREQSEVPRLVNVSRGNVELEAEGAERQKRGYRRRPPPPPSDRQLRPRSQSTENTDRATEEGGNTSSEREHEDANSDGENLDQRMLVKIERDDDDVVIVKDEAQAPSQAPTMRRVWSSVMSSSMMSLPESVRASLQPSLVPTPDLTSIRINVANLAPRRRQTARKSGSGRGTRKPSSDLLDMRSSSSQTGEGDGEGDDDGGDGDGGAKKKAVKR